MFFLKQEGKIKFLLSLFDKIFLISCIDHDELLKVHTLKAVHGKRVWIFTRKEC